jgi:hypothetical protein
MPDLLLLTSYLDQVQYFSKQEFKINTSLQLALEKSMISSANITLVKSRPLTFILTPLILLAACSLSMSLDQTSWQRMNKWGDKGSPYLRPLEGENCLDLPPFMSTEKETVLTHSITH